jgi:DNA-binding YbaB/EbfC family protein
MFGLDQQAIMQQMQLAAAESKKRLDEAVVTGESGGGLLRIEMTGNRALKAIEIRTSIKDMEKEDLEDLLSVALSRALEAANQLNDQEMSASARQFIPGL